LKSNPYKHKKYSFEIKEQKRLKSRRIRVQSDWSISGFFKKIFSRKKTNPGEDIFHTRGIFLDTPHQKNRPAWLIPILAILGISLVVFWVGPFVINTITKVFVQSTDNNTNTILKFNTPDYAVVKDQIIDLFQEPDLKAMRKSQVLYNQVVKIIDRSTYGFYQVVLDDKTTGFIMSEDVTSDTKSIEPELYKFKIVIISKSKRIMTHSSNGSTIVEALMGTVLYSNYQGDGIYKVSLPDNSQGWVSANGVLKIEANAEIQKSNVKSFYTTVLSFNDTTYINQGMTQNGASSEGIAYIAAKVNGVLISRDKQEQSKAGQAVTLLYDEETGMPKFDGLSDGDLVFFRSSMDPSIIGEMGIVVGYGQVLMSRNSKASVKMVNLASDTTLAKSIMTVRRIF